MTRILVSIPDELHEMLRELAVRNHTSMSKLILAAVEETYEEELDAIVGERALASHLADPSAYVAWDEVKTRLRAQAEASLKKSTAKKDVTKKPKKTTPQSPARKKVGVQG